jgi:hypothetical protein
MAGDVRDWSGLATQTLDTLYQRRDQVDAHTEERRELEDSALRRFAVAAVAIDEAWTAGARRVEELERQAEQIRDDVRARTSRLEAEQAAAVLDLLRVRPAEDLAALLGVPVEQVLSLIRDAEDRVTPDRVAEDMPRPRTHSDHDRTPV